MTNLPIIDRHVTNKDLKGALSMTFMSFSLLKKWLFLQKKMVVMFMLALLLSLLSSTTLNCNAYCNGNCIAYNKCNKEGDFEIIEKCFTKDSLTRITCKPLSFKTENKNDTELRKIRHGVLCRAPKSECRCLVHDFEHYIRVCGCYDPTPLPTEFPSVGLLWWSGTKRKEKKIHIPTEFQLNGEVYKLSDGSLLKKKLSETNTTSFEIQVADGSGRTYTLEFQLNGEVYKLSDGSFLKKKLSETNMTSFEIKVADGRGTYTQEFQLKGEVHKLSDGSFLKNNYSSETNKTSFEIQVADGKGKFTQYTGNIGNKTCLVTKQRPEKQLYSSVWGRYFSGDPKINLDTSTKMAGKKRRTNLQTWKTHDDHYDYKYRWTWKVEFNDVTRRVIPIQHEYRFEESYPNEIVETSTYNYKFTELNDGDMTFQLSDYCSKFHYPTSFPRFPSIGVIRWSGVNDKSEGKYHMKGEIHKLDDGDFFKKEYSSETHLTLFEIFVADGKGTYTQYTGNTLSKTCKVEKRRPEKTLQSVWEKFFSGDKENIKMKSSKRKVDDDTKSLQTWNTHEESEDEYWESWWTWTVQSDDATSIAIPIPIAYKQTFYDYDWGEDVIKTYDYKFTKLSEGDKSFQLKDYCKSEEI